ncbi:MAG: putative manganese-dependent inorganic diphosphatase [Erysipelotrichaceae bacterium]|nr:putative manganese-dependent inorganic diphosphatase [Erysipelotrichaceae bacterium]
MNEIYVSGHKNPDSDSICAAISYSYLLNASKKYKEKAIPVRLGEINRETEYILKTFGLEIPMLLKTVKQKVEDLEYDKVTVFSKELTLKTAWFLMKEQNLKSAPVLDEHNKLLGLLSATNMLEGYMDEWDGEILKKANTPIENVIDTLEAQILYLDEDLKTVTGDVHVAAMNSEEAMKRIQPGDFCIVGGDRNHMIKALVDGCVSMIVLTGAIDVEPQLLVEARRRKVSVITTRLNTFEAARLILQAIPVEYVMLKSGLTTFSTDDTVDYLRDIMGQTRFRSYPVLDLNDRVVGTISRFQVLSGGKKKLVQVDHNERGQAVDGIEEAEILEVVDHHRVADFQTIGPLNFRAEPLGCTCTIIYKMFREQDIEIPANIAGAMLGAIISDTLLFRSPTCTPTDTRTAMKLAEIAGVDAKEFGMDMFKAGTSLVGKSIEEIFNSDFKKFNIGDLTVGVGQVNTMDIEGFASYKPDMLDYMENVCKENNFAFAILLLTDVIRTNSEVYVAGERPELVENAFGVRLADHQATLKGIISRKKQVVPAITTAITNSL